MEEVLRQLGRITVAFNLLEDSLRTMIAILINPQEKRLAWLWLLI
jgi:hypothetical protein